MASDATFEFTDANFDAEAMQHDAPVLVDFWAEWCGPCRALAPTIDKLAGEYAGKVRVGKLDVDSNQATAMKFSIQSIPTMILLKDGEVVKKIVGLASEKDLSAALDETLVGA